MVLIDGNYDNAISLNTVGAYSVSSNNMGLFQRIGVGVISYGKDKALGNATGVGSLLFGNCVAGTGVYNNPPPAGAICDDIVSWQ